MMMMIGGWVGGSIHMMSHPSERPPSRRAMRSRHPSKPDHSEPRDPHTLGPRGGALHFLK
jgi:hypothetical protein